MSRFRRFLTVQAALITAIALAAPAAAFAQVPPPDPGTGPGSAAKHVVVISHHSPLWTFIVVALVAAAITAIALATATHFRNRGRRPAMA